MTEPTASLVELARRYGVATEYENWTGARTAVAEPTLISVLGALGVQAATEDDRAAALTAHDREYWSRHLPPTIIGRTGATSTFRVHVTHGSPVALRVTLEDGSVRTDLSQLENNRPPYNLDGRLIGEASFELPTDLPIGYHRLVLQADSSEFSTPIIVSPASLRPPAGRQWGLATQVYSVRSERSWGIGDLTDLTDLAVWSAARHGAGFILVNPLHAAAPVAPMQPSPYLPTSRRFVNPIYLRVEAVPEYAYVRRRNRIRKLREAVQSRADRADRIDRDAAWKAKRSALEAGLRGAALCRAELAYAAYRRREGRSLDDFATSCALAERHGGDWRQWPRTRDTAGTWGILADVDGDGWSEFVHAQPDGVIRCFDVGAPRSRCATCPPGTPDAIDSPPVSIPAAGRST